MLITVVATLCQLATSSCVEEIITDQASLQSCAITGQIGISKWMAESEKYHSGWNVHGYKCVIGYRKAQAL